MITSCTKEGNSQLTMKSKSILQNIFENKHALYITICWMWLVRPFTVTICGAEAWQQFWFLFSLNRKIQVSSLYLMPKDVTYMSNLNTIFTFVVLIAEEVFSISRFFTMNAKQVKPFPTRCTLVLSTVFPTAANFRTTVLFSGLPQLTHGCWEEHHGASKVRWLVCYFRQR